MKAQVIARVTAHVTAAELELYVTGALDANRAESFEAHCAACEACALALAREASRNGCDAVVIGAPSSRWTRLTGGVARHLERHTDIEVIVVPAQDAPAPAGNVRTVLGGGARVRPA